MFAITLMMRLHKLLRITSGNWVMGAYMLLHGYALFLGTINIDKTQK